MDEPGLSRPSLRNAVSSALARIKHEFYGKGPSRVRTYVYDRIIFSVLDDVLTPVELTLKAGGRSALVRRTRLTFEDIMTTTFTGQIERLTAARVLAYHSQIVFDPDMAIEIFVLDRPPTPAVTAPGEARSLPLEPPGRAGDADRLPTTAAESADPLAAGSKRGEGRLRAALSDAMTRVLYEHWRKGPTRAMTYLEDDFVFCVLEEPLTTVERTLVGGGQTDLVRELRLEFHELVAEELADQVEGLTGRPVLGSHCQVVFDPDILIEIFVLGAPG